MFASVKGYPQNMRLLDDLKLRGLISVYCIIAKDNIYIDMQAGRNLLPKLLVADN